MSLTYFKRYRMETDVRRPRQDVRLPLGFRFVPWSLDRLLDHAEAKHAAFRDELDASVFGCLGDIDGCLRLMEEIASKPGFLPEATWLVEHVDEAGFGEPVGTIQGIRVTPRYGSIQNVGVAPWARGRRIGAALIGAALRAFREVGLQRATLEVTASNTRALRVYESLGFLRARTSFRAVDLAEA